MSVGRCGHLRRPVRKQGVRSRTVQDGPHDQRTRRAPRRPNRLSPLAPAVHRWPPRNGQVAVIGHHQGMTFRTLLHRRSARRRSLSLLTVALVLALASISGPSAMAVGRTDPTHDLPAGPAAPTASASSFLLPVDSPPMVLTPFRAPSSRYGVGHRGVDLAAPQGTTVHAAADGTVVFAGVLAGRGVVSVLHDGGLRTTYEPVTAVVGAADQVSAGQVLGVLTAGHPSCAPAICLHWGARLPDGSYLDPMSLRGAWRVRLLPWDG